MTPRTPPICLAEVLRLKRPNTGFEVRGARTAATELIRMRGVFPSVHLRALPFNLRTIRRRKVMTLEINGFAIEPCSSNRHPFRRTTEPRHEYIFEITPERVVLRATLPDEAGVDRRDALDDAERSERHAHKAAEELQRRTFS